MLKGEFQENFPQIKNKLLRHALSSGDKIYLIASNVYDTDVDILSTDPEDVANDFKTSVATEVEPGHFQVYDTFTDGEVIKTLMRVGEHLHIDTISLTACLTPNPRDGILSQVVEHNYHSMSFSWPNFAYATKKNKVFIFTAFNQ